MRELTVELFYTEMELQGMDNRKDTAFVCPMCGTAQSFNSFLKAGAKKEDIPGLIGFSCIGRLTGAGSPRKEPDGKPCNWTLGGFLQFHKLVVVDEKGVKHPHFEVASTKQAEDLKQSLEA